MDKDVEARLKSVEDAVQDLKDGRTKNIVWKKVAIGLSLAAALCAFLSLSVSFMPELAGVRSALSTFAIALTLISGIMVLMTS